MKCVQFTSVENYLDHCQTFLIKNESENSLPLGVAISIKEKMRKASSPYYFAIENEQQILAVAQRTNLDRPMFLSKMDAVWVKLLCEKMMPLNISLEGVVGLPYTSETFSEIYSQKNGLSCKLSMRQGLYELKKVLMPELDGEQLIVASTNEAKTCHDYMLGFVSDCFPNHKSPREEAQKISENLLTNKNLYLLKNKTGEFVSMIGNSRNSPNGASISYVYTPKIHRRNGYGSKITALLSQKLLDQGFKFCNLYTDLLNPTSNSIYKKIGYEMIGENKHISFFK